MPSIAGHRVLVLGASSGIGFAVAKLTLSENIAHLAIASSNRTKLDNAVKALIKAVPGSEDRISSFLVDLGGEDTETQLEQVLADAVAAAGGPLDHIVHSVDYKTIHGLFVPRFAQLALLGKLSPKYMNGKGTSSIIFTSGHVEDVPMPGLGVLSSVGAAITGMAIGLAVDISPIRVNAVAPGITETPMVIEETGETMASAIYDLASRQSLVGRPGTADEAAEAFVYLMKDTNATGASVKSSGGSIIRSA
ncbi:enoyl-(Acyl carrier protein) reductase domain-containing protein [Trichoderma breve]|uniref:Enoyl-(Acyl carrier protein) reductase domain-containing protein n=1 Tax=Trichoderma breve TaxID=2034170 RepID=A0A9W9BIW7_9HYPO|nr:enoyl-(Acyl carrier protein) reductase domain-containing protein [Trichoderma breve]KAJ4860683.1 enoyl-(Acyl carrier protein) reductase domain-containing protein [Trichoderma breve]